MEKYAAEINKSIKEQMEEAPQGKKWQHFEDAVIHALKTFATKDPSVQHKPWITKETLDLIEKKSNLFRSIRKQK